MQVFDAGGAPVCAAGPAGTLPSLGALGGSSSVLGLLGKQPVVQQELASSGWQVLQDSFTGLNGEGPIVLLIAAPPVLCCCLCDSLSGMSHVVVVLCPVPETVFV